MDAATTTLPNTPALGVAERHHGIVLKQREPRSVARALRVGGSSEGVIAFHHE
jgi:hypothetical protein